jgi:hypothetical protein
LEAGSSDVANHYVPRQVGIGYVTGKGLSDSNSCMGLTYDTSANYIKASPEYINGSTAKPG